MVRLKMRRRAFAGLRRWVPFPLMAVWLGAAPGVLAHDPGLSTITIKLFTNRLEAVLGFSLLDSATIVDLDKDHDGRITREELIQGAAEFKRAARDALEVSFNGNLAPVTDTRCEFDSNNTAMVSLSCPAIPFTNLVIRSTWLALLPPGHRQMLTLREADGQVLAERLLSANYDQVTIEIDPAQTTPGTPAKTSAFADFLLMGVKHIWTGYDHVLFLFGLLIVTRNFASSVKIITCFTLAHSLTLAVATLSLVRISSRLVEPLIAASIVYVGVENLLRGDDPKGRWLLTFAFGLIHGFGFASVLRELGVGINGAGITVPLVSFNLGVELGQVVIAALVLPVIWKLRASPVFLRRWVPACSMAVALLGTFWFVQRIWF
jgi:hydrogenase/urease accessory protein HupE